VEAIAWLPKRSIRSFRAKCRIGLSGHFGAHSREGVRIAAPDVALQMLEQGALLIDHLSSCFGYPFRILGYYA
jgi:hypothetical protein